MSGSSSVPSLPTQEAIHRMLAERVDACRLSVGVVVGVTEAARPFTVSHGLRGAKRDRAVDGRTIFEIGSITKLFTALLLADLSSRGEAKLDEPVADLLPAGTRVPAYDGRHITLRDLAFHRSGLPTLPTHSADPCAPYTVDDLYAFLAAHELARPPGQTSAYSDLGFGLLGHALAVRAGSPDYESLLRTRILSPLAMHDTVIALPPRLLDRAAAGHDEELDPAPAWNAGVLAGASGLRSSVCDLLLWLDALRDTDSPIAAMVRPLVAAPSPEGLGMSRLHPDGGNALLITGRTHGFRSYAACVPQWQRGVVVLSNSVLDRVMDIGQHVLDTRFARNWYPREVATDPCVLARLVGRYRLGPRLAIDVTSKDDRLYVRLSGQAAFRVFPQSEWQFFSKTSPAELTFEPGADGRAARLVLRRGSGAQVAERLA